MQVECNLSHVEQLKRGSDRVCNLILSSDLPCLDIEIEVNQLHELCCQEMPEKLDLFEAVYTCRFKRLWEQLREFA